MISNKTKYVICFLLLWVVSCNQEKDMKATSPPDNGQRLVAEKAMVSSAHPLASKIGVEIMKKGGTAIDADVGTTLAAGVVEPEMSGIGGGGAMVVWLEEDNKGIYIDFYASKRVKTYGDVSSSDWKGQHLLDVGIPGNVAGLLYAEKKYGKLSRQEVMRPAIDLARNGFFMYKVLAENIDESAEKLKKYKGGDIYLPNGDSYPVGKIFKAEKLAESLEKIAKEGRSAFYEGELTQDIIKELNKGGNPVSETDFKNYKVRTKKEPLV